MAIRQLNIKDRTYYFYNNLINKKRVLGNDVYYIDYIKKTTVEC